jgi:hypothetical protein
MEGPSLWPVPHKREVAVVSSSREEIIFKGKMFKSLLLVGALAAAAASHPHLERASFEDHVAKYGLTFSQGSAEWHQRKALFESERERVIKHNASGK